MNPALKDSVTGALVGCCEPHSIDEVTVVKATECTICKHWCREAGATTFEEEKVLRGRGKGWCSKCKDA